jgi:hypothetical protein
LRKLLALAVLLAVLAFGGYALADDPDGDLQEALGDLIAAQDHLASAQGIIEAEIAKPPVVQTVTETVTETVTAPPSTSTPPPTTPPPPTPPPTTPPPTTPPPTVTTPPPAPGFPTRAQALAGNVVVVSGDRTAQFKPGPATEVTYDLRGLNHTGFPPGYPIVIEGTRNVVIGGSVTGQQSRTASWAQVHDDIGGQALRMPITDYGVSYDFRADNTNDGFEMRPQSGISNQRFLIEGAYLTWIRDDALEDDTEISGTFRDVLVDGVNNAISIGQSTKNPNAVVNVEDVIFIHAPMVNDRAADGIGHQTLFKQAPGGRVNLTNVTVCMYENPISPGRIGIRPPGEWENVTFVLGPGWNGSDPNVPNGADVSRDWQGECIDAANAWRAVHGY